MSDDELAQFGRAARGCLKRHWSSALSAGAPESGGKLLGTLWDVAIDVGWTGLAAERATGALVVLSAELGRVACPWPAMDVFAAGLLFDHRPELALAVAEGQLRPIAAPGLDTREGGERLMARYADAAGPATDVLVLPGNGTSISLVTIDGIQPLAGLAAPPWCDAVVSHEVTQVEVTAEKLQSARALLRLGLAARAMGAAARSHELALDHATSRQQFGRVIGSFQAVQHRLADSAIDLAAGQGLIEEAVRLESLGDPNWPLASELGVTYTLHAAPRIQLAAHRTLAAVGYFEEHEAPWLFRRVHADVVRARTFPLACGEPADMLIETGASLPRLDLGPRGEQVRAEIRAFLKANPATAPTGIVDDPKFVRVLAEAGYLGFGLPEKYGGRNSTVEEEMALEEELSYQRVPAAMARAATRLLGRTIATFGTTEQQERFLPLIASGDLRFYLGYSEPEVGSDLASLQTRAVRDGDEWMVNGRKMWGTGAHTADYVWLAARTNSDVVNRRDGITVFLAPTGLPGWEAQQHKALSGEISCSTFFDDVRVPDSYRIGDVNGGWKVITSALAAERVVMAGNTAAMHRQLDDLLEIVRADPDGIIGPRGSAARARLTSMAARLQASRVLLNGSIRATAAGTGGWLEAPMAKVLSGDLAEEFGEFVLETLGPTAMLSATEPEAPGGGAFEYGLRMAPMYVIGGGTGDIQRNLIARGLGLPR